jgi:hypothetical protein
LRLPIQPKLELRIDWQLPYETIRMQPEHVPKAIRLAKYMTSHDRPLDNLAHWIVSHWESGFSHSYSIAKSKSNVWKKWRTEIQPTSQDTWWCESISQAAKHYSWTESKPSFEELSIKLRCALKDRNSTTCAEICLEIFKWGGVARKQGDRSRCWVQKHRDAGGLCKKIDKAVGLLRPDNNQSLDSFDGVDLLMNSALTKVYAAADSQKSIVIYDGRVGAALGLITRRMLEKQAVTVVPEDLGFEWGPPSTRSAAQARTRDPSRASLSFTQLPNTSQNKKADLRRAELSRVTNLLCQKVLRFLKDQGVSSEPIEIEKALFMIGYDVRTTN